MYNAPEKYPSQNFDILFGRFLNFGALVDESGFNWVIPGDVYKKYIKHFGDFTPILIKFGFKTSESGGNIILNNEKYPLFLKYYYRFCEVASKCGTGVLSCDFSAFIKKRKFTLDDFLRTQSDKNKVYFKELHEYATGKGAKLKTDNPYRRYRYIYKKQHIVFFEMSAICVNYNEPYYSSRKIDSRVSFDIFMAEVDKQPDRDELIKYLYNTIHLCDSCRGRKAGPKNSDERCNFWIDFDGIKCMAAACCPDITKRYNPQKSQGYTDYDIKMLKRMIDIRFAQIDNIK